MNFLIICWGRGSDLVLLSLILMRQSITGTLVIPLCVSPVDSTKTWWRKIDVQVFYLLTLCFTLLCFIVFVDMCENFLISNERRVVVVEEGFFLWFIDQTSMTGMSILPFPSTLKVSYYIVRSSPFFICFTLLYF